MRNVNDVEEEEYMQEGSALELNIMQRKVFDVLVCPIVATKNINEIGMFFKEDKRIILSSQAYEGNPDEDMCDLSIGFYEILYDLERGSILKQQGSVKEWNYAGDTMNSFVTITTFSSVEKRNEWNEVYHCLANFWMLPGRIGRMTNKESKNSAGKYAYPITINSFNTGKRDYMDRFLKEYLKEYLKEQNRDENRDAIKDFATKHFIDEIYVSSEHNSIIEFSTVEEGCNLQEASDSIIDIMMDNICKRALAIVSNEEKCNNLFKYFKDLKLIED